MSSKPAACNLQRIIEGAPACLRERRQWVCWQYELRKDKWTKIPVNPRTKGNASSTDQTTWGSFEEVVSACQQAPGLAGVGYVFSAEDPFCGVDLDDCIDPATGELKAWGQQFIDQLDSYSEISPSGTGVKVFVEAVKPGARCRRPYNDGEVEIYDRDRFFTVTGQVLAGPCEFVSARQLELEGVYATVFGEAGDDDGILAGTNPVTKPYDLPRPDPSSRNSDALDDDQILQRASRSRSGAKFKALWAGHPIGFSAFCV